MAFQRGIPTIATGMRALCQWTGGYGWSAALGQADSLARLGKADQSAPKLSRLPEGKEQKNLEKLHTCILPHAAVFLASVFTFWSQRTGIAGPEQNRSHRCSIWVSRTRDRFGSPNKKRLRAAQARASLRCNNQLRPSPSLGQHAHAHAQVRYARSRTRRLPGYKWHER